MRRSEMLSLQWQHTDLDAGLAILLDTKNGSKKKVSLTPRARCVISNCLTTPVLFSILRTILSAMAGTVW